MTSTFGSSSGEWRISMRSVVLLLAFLVGFGGIANATTLQSRDWATHGDGLLTLDTNTNLLWLDLTASQFLTPTGGLGSFTYVSSLLGTGQMFDGFRYATLDEVNTLFGDALLPSIPAPGSSAPGDNPGAVAPLSSVNNFISLFGQTDCISPCSGAGGAFGILGTSTGNVLVAGPWYQGDQTSKNISFYTGENSTGGFGSFLVKSAESKHVPEPPSLLLLGIGLAGVFVVKSRRLFPGRH